MTPIYQHTQPGTTMLGVIFFAMMAVVGGVMSQPEATWSTVAPALLIPGIILVAIAIAFASLTITVDATTLSWRFGPGIIRKSVPVREIARVEQVRLGWMAGWGIRITPIGWLYNVSGRDAVQIILRDSKTFLLGTDDARSLKAALDAAAGN